MDKHRMSLRQISVRARSKKEIYRILQLEADVYLPPIQQANRKYIAELVSGKKKHLKNAQLKTIQVPHLEGLRVNNILGFARKNTDIDKYLPVFKNPDKAPDREWTCNVVNTLISDQFKKFVMDAVSKSDQRYAVKMRDEIEIAPEFAKLFLESKTYSRSKGKFSQLLKPSRRDTEMENEEEEEKEVVEVRKLKQSNKDKDELISELKKELISFKNERLSMLEDREKLAKLYELGLIDDAGDPLFVDRTALDNREGKEELMKF